jgi:hypothetical protein
MGLGARTGCVYEKENRRRRCRATTGRRESKLNPVGEEGSGRLDGAYTRQGRRSR